MLLKEKVMEHRGKHAPVPTFLELVFVLHNNVITAYVIITEEKLINCAFRLTCNANTKFHSGELLQAITQTDNLQYLITLSYTGAITSLNKSGS